MKRAERWVPYLLLLPALVLLLVFYVLLALAGLGEALYTHNLSRTRRAFVGLGNFRRIFSDPTFWRSLRVTMVFSRSSIPSRLLWRWPWLCWPISACEASGSTAASTSCPWWSL